MAILTMPKLGPWTSFRMGGYTPRHRMRRLLLCNKKVVRTIFVGAPWGYLGAASAGSEHATPRPEMGLVDRAAVERYLQHTAFATVNVRQIALGTTNFAFRLFYPDGINERNERTAILKYSAPYVAGEPHVRFAAERQHHEVAAMTQIPWQDFAGRGCPRREQKQCAGPEPGFPQVKIPRIYWHDPSKHVIIMEDCIPQRLPPGEIWDQTIHSARRFLECTPPTSVKYRTAEMIGTMLGSFLAEMHAWGRRNRHCSVVAQFECNHAAKDLTARETFTDFFQGVEHHARFKLASGMRSQLHTRIQALEEAFFEERDTVLMGDFWYRRIALEHLIH